jgi:hypothetical protein
MGDDALLEATGIVKYFGHVQALRGADFTVRHNEVVALDPRRYVDFFSSDEAHAPVDLQVTSLKTGRCGNDSVQQA